MNTTVTLPSFLNPYKFDDLIRVGRDNDGGYVIREIDVIETKNLISFGLCFDFSFEKNFLNKNKLINIHTFDGSVGFKYYIKKLKYRIKFLLLRPNKKNLIRVLEVIRLLYDFSLFYKFNLFKNIKHTEKFVSSDISQFRDFKKYYGYKPKIIQFQDIFTKNLRKVFLSIDIEGGEYDLLEEINSYSKNLTGLIIEFHDVDKNLKRIESFLKKCELLLIHTHINNFGPIKNGIPSVIELSFSRNIENIEFGLLKLVDKLPINLDQPNNENCIDYKVIFS